MSAESKKPASSPMTGAKKKETRCKPTMNEYDDLIQSMEWETEADALLTGIQRELRKAKKENQDHDWHNPWKEDHL